jgi:formylmethanofuran dehydrogenase subunit C
VSREGNTNCKIGALVKGTVVVLHGHRDEPIGKHMTVGAKHPLDPTIIATGSLGHGCGRREVKEIQLKLEEWQGIGVRTYI